MSSEELALIVSFVEFLISNAPSEIQVIREIEAAIEKHKQSVASEVKSE
jgi:hypothetical protein